MRCEYCNGDKVVSALGRSQPAEEQYLRRLHLSHRQEEIKEPLVADTNDQTISAKRDILDHCSRETYKFYTEVEDRLWQYETAGLSPKEYHELLLIINSTEEVVR